MGVMGEKHSMAIMAKNVSLHTCAGCRNQKRKCSKTLPTCTRCAKSNTECNYDWYVEERQQRCRSGNALSDFLFFHVPVTGDHKWLPCALEPLQQHKRNIQSRKLDIDQFLVGVMITTLFEHGDCTERVVEAYFQKLHFWVPVIHELTLRLKISQLECKPHAETAHLILVMQLLMKEGNRAVEHRDRQSHLHYLCKYLFFLLQHTREPSVALIQAGLLLAIYEAGCGNPQAASLSIGSCARLGYMLRLHDNQMDNNDAFSCPVKAEEHRRVWVGIYMVDRLIYQITGNVSALHVVEEPANRFRLPVDDGEWDRGFPNQALGHFQPIFSTPINIHISPFAREVQAVRILGWVQMLSKHIDSESFHSQVESIDNYQLQFLRQLFEQAPGNWEMIFGANAVALLASIALHRTRLGARTEGSCARNDRSILALRSSVKMITDICIQFNGLDISARPRSVSLPAIICTGEAGLAALWLNTILEEKARLDVKPLRKFLKDAVVLWSIGDNYLAQMSSSVVR